MTTIFVFTPGPTLLPFSSDVPISKSLSLTIATVVWSSTTKPSTLSGTPGSLERSATSVLGSATMLLAARSSNASRLGVVATASHWLPRMFVALLMSTLYSFATVSARSTISNVVALTSVAAESFISSRSSFGSAAKSLIGSKRYTYSATGFSLATSKTSTRVWREASPVFLSGLYSGNIGPQSISTSSDTVGLTAGSTEGVFVRLPDSRSYRRHGAPDQT